MSTSLYRRLRREEEGYALVVAVILISVMMVLMAVSLTAATSSLRNSEDSVRFARTLSVAEAGVNDAITRLGENRTSTSPCLRGSATTCTASGGVYQVSWARNAGNIVVTADGYYPSLASPRFHREIQVTFEPVPTFRYALYSQDSLSVKNTAVVVGDLYSSASITVDNNTIICGNVEAAGGDINLGGGTQVLKNYAAANCSGKGGLVWANGSIINGNGVVIEGDAKASAPSSTNCVPSANNNYLSGGTVDGTATACGKITGVTSPNTQYPGTSTTPPQVTGLPAFVFDPNNYSSISCYPSTGTCGPNNTSPTAVSSFQTYFNANKTTMTGTFAIWQTAPSQATKISLDGIKLSGDLTIITNAPVDLGNTSCITTGSGCPSAGAAPADFTLVSLYVPPTGSTCDTNGGNCSIYSQNKIVFDVGVASDPNDGIAGLVYTPGKMAVKNQGSSGEGALYAGSMDIKNGFSIAYNSRIERQLGFGLSFQRTLWKELNV
jgi:hypothetical protein